MDSARWAGAAVLAVGMGLAGCATTDITTDSTEAPAEDELNLVSQADRAVAEIQSKGLFLRDPVVTDYVRAVGARVTPASAAVRFHVIRDSLANAYAFPNGDVLVTIGLLARLENEAQLAFVLAHEAAHVYEKHGVEQMRNRRSTVVTAHIADLVLLGTSIAYLPAASALVGYSRAQEAEADAVGLRLLASAGYPVDAVPGIFAVIEESKVPKDSGASVWSDHPSNEERESALRQALEQGELARNTGAEPGIEPYHAVRQHIVHATLDLKLRHGQFELARDGAEQALRLNPADPWLHYYRGEAVRRMGANPKAAAREHAWLYDKTDDEALVEKFRQDRPRLYAEARADFERALRLDPSFTRAHRGLGMIAYDLGDEKRARHALTRYLEGEEDVRDARYIRTLLREMDDERN